MLLNIDFNKEEKEEKFLETPLAPCLCRQHSRQLIWQHSQIFITSFLCAVL